MAEECVPNLGDWLMPKDREIPPGMVVAVLPCGDKVVLGGYLPPNTWDLFPRGGYVETVHKSVDLKGPTTGRVVRP